MRKRLSRGYRIKNDNMTCRFSCNSGSCDKNRSLDSVCNFQAVAQALIKLKQGHPFSSSIALSTPVVYNHPYISITKYSDPETETRHSWIGAVPWSRDIARTNNRNIISIALGRSPAGRSSWWGGWCTASPYSGTDTMSFRGSGSIRNKVRGSKH